MAYTVIDFPAEYFNTKLYTGNGSSQSITGVGFKPDWIWVKSRSAIEYHYLWDSVRGVGKSIYSNATDAEFTDNKLTSFDSDGFSLNTVGQANASGVTYASWNWLASNTTTSNTSGTISSTVSANTTSGFSIVSYTGNATAGATVGHGLGVTPKMIIIKDRDNGTTAWFVYHSAIGTAGTGRLNSTNAFSDTTFMTTAPSSTVITLTGATIVNGSSEKMIAYCFAEVKGFSKFGSYTGNGSTDGTFVYTGFKPAFVLVKNITTAGTNWQIVDNKRVGYNGANHRLYPDDSAAESTTQTLDILSNGFKAITTNNLVNASGSTYIYMAFAENPFVSSKGIPCTAR